MRNIFVLSEMIQNLIPNTDDGLDIKRELKIITNKFLYKPPELWNPWFHAVSKLLTIKLSSPDTKWKQTISDLFSEKPRKNEWEKES